MAKTCFLDKNAFQRTQKPLTEPDYLVSSYLDLVRLRMLADVRGRSHDVWGASSLGFLRRKP